jgi:transcriptional regulator GlxA family with amidase domain
LRCEAREEATMIAALVGAAALLAPSQGPIPVAFVLSEGATMIDFAGPWEVFQDVHVESRGPGMDDQMPFRLYTVSDSRAPIRVSGGMQVTPDYTFADAPAPRIVVVGAQGGKSKQMLEWLRRAATQSQVLMSVCTGAYKLAMAGILDGKKASTHHDFWDDFQKRFPKVTLERGVRYVRSDPVVFTAGGLTSGIDLALHIVELYFGRDVAARTAAYMEYEGKGWMRTDG